MEDVCECPGVLAPFVAKVNVLHLIAFVLRKDLLTVFCGSIAGFPLLLIDPLVCSQVSMTVYVYYSFTLSFKIK